MTDALAMFEWQRLAMLVLFLVAFLLYCWNVGRMWQARSRPANLLAVGFLAALAYLTAGQIKAAAYSVPVDALTYFGGVSALTIIVALVLLQLGGRRHEGA